MITRIITAVAAIAVFAAILIAPNAVFTIALAAVIFMMLYECFHATKADALMKAFGYFGAALIIVTALFSDSLANRFHTSGSSLFIIAAIAVSILLHMLLVVILHTKRDYIDVLANAFLMLYAVVTMGCVWLMRKWFGTSRMLLIFVCAWSCDTFAYFTGRFFGKRKLIPNVSPNKTVAGAVGGVVGAVIGCFVCLCAAEFFANRREFQSLATQIPTFILYSAVLGICGGVCSQIGDLAASAVKRDTGIKDFGSIFPGHGGFMDRFDSVMYIAPILLIIYYFTVVML